MTQDDSSPSRLGDPLDGGTPQPVEPAKAQPGPDTVETGSCVRREGDFGLGVPEEAVGDRRPLSDRETQAHQAELEEQLRQKAKDMLAELERAQGWHLPAGVRRACSGVLITVAAVLGLFVVSQTVQFAADIRALPEWGQWLAAAGVILFGGVLAMVVGGLLWGVVRLRRSPRIHLKAMAILAERQRMQRFALESQEQARTMLEAYLHDYPVSQTGWKRLFAIGMTEDEWARLQFVRNRLLDASRLLETGEWLEDFKDFQTVLDEVARRRINKYAKRVGFGTAASPLAMVDQMIVLYGSTAMVKDLFAIYRLRPAFGQTAVILSRSMVHTYLSGVLEEATETISQTLSDSMAAAVGEGVGVVTGTLGKEVCAKGAEATLNGVLIWRLGKSAMKLLQPVKAG